MKDYPLIVKIIFGVVPLLCVAIWFVYLQLDGFRYKNRFYKEGFSSIVVSSNSYYGRSVQFHFANGLRVYFMPPVDNKIKIGDSVYKEKNTYLYNVYRKGNNGKFDLYARYNIEPLFAQVWCKPINKNWRKNAVWPMCCCVLVPFYFRRYDKQVAQVPCRTKAIAAYLREMGLWPVLTHTTVIFKRMAVVLLM